MKFSQVLNKAPLMGLLKTNFLFIPTRKPLGYAKVIENAAHRV